MDDDQWRRFLLACVRILGPGEQHDRSRSASWCSFTTFGRLANDAGYWTHGLPAEDDIEAGWTKDGGVWGQPFRFAQLAHFILPRRFYWDRVVNGEWECGERIQDLESLSAVLRAEQIEHRLTTHALEIKLF